MSAMRCAQLPYSQSAQQAVCAEDEVSGCFCNSCTAQLDGCFHTMGTEGHIALLLHEASAVADAAGMHPELPLLPTACWQDRSSFRGQSDVYRFAGIELRDYQLTARLAATDILCNCWSDRHEQRSPGPRICCPALSARCLTSLSVFASVRSDAARWRALSLCPAGLRCEIALSSTHMRGAQVKNELVIRCMKLSRSRQVLWQR